MTSRWHPFTELRILHVAPVCQIRSATEERHRFASTNPILLLSFDKRIHGHSRPLNIRFTFWAYCSRKAKFQQMKVRSGRALGLRLRRRNIERGIVEE